MCEGGTDGTHARDCEKRVERVRFNGRWQDQGNGGGRSIRSMATTTTGKRHWIRPAACCAKLLIAISISGIRAKPAFSMAVSAMDRIGWNHFFVGVPT